MATLSPPTPPLPPSSPPLLDATSPTSLPALTLILAATSVACSLSPGRSKELHWCHDTPPCLAVVYPTHIQGGPTGKHYRSKPGGASRFTSTHSGVLWRGVSSSCVAAV
ncbi:hypothetical protein PVAP13_1NG116520 [Panicum virgatum]|uniref:Uncharacterized protein n=1 Tax=Panicum virgatum TaxID=38727 RepID=A0A8T0WIA0_PANVG|nr:hypothetical protein PVAP13_1NG116520 [Panicum virgatum]